MSAVRFTNKLTLMAQDGSDATISTDPYPIGAMTQCNLMVNIEVLDGTGGTPTVDILAEASNDGQTYLPANPISLPGLTASGLSEAEGHTLAAFIRFKITLSVVGGAPGNLAWSTLDLHVNFTTP